MLEAALQIQSFANTANPSSPPGAAATATASGEPALQNRIEASDAAQGATEAENPFQRLLNDALDTTPRQVFGDLGTGLSTRRPAGAESIITSEIDSTVPAELVGTAPVGPVPIAAIPSLATGSEAAAPTTLLQNNSGNPLPVTGNTTPTAGSITPTTADPVIQSDLAAGSNLTSAASPQVLPRDLPREATALLSRSNLGLNERAETPSLTTQPLGLGGLPPPPTGLSPPASPLLVSATPTAAPMPFAEQLAELTLQGQGDAELRLSPPHLGSVSVRISISGEQASVMLVTPNPEVRNLVEASLPQLEELLNESGLSLGNTSVSDGSNQEPRQRTTPASGIQSTGEDPERNLALIRPASTRALDLFV